MLTLKLNVLEERALEVIRYLEAVKDIEIVRDESNPMQREPIKWVGMIENPSSELLEYADKVRGEWEDRI